MVGARRIWSRLRMRSRSGRSRRCRCRRAPGTAVSGASATPPPRGRERLADLVLRARADAAAAGEAHPMASVDQQPDRPEEQHARDRRGTGTRGDDGQCARGQSGAAARDSSSDSPVLLTAGVAHTENGQTLAFAADKCASARAACQSPRTSRPPAAPGRYLEGRAPWATTLQIAP